MFKTIVSIAGLLIVTLIGAHQVHPILSVPRQPAAAALVSPSNQPASEGVKTNTESSSTVLALTGESATSLTQAFPTDIPAPIRQPTPTAILSNYITQDALTAQLQQATNALRTLIYQNESAPNSLPATGGYTNDIAMSNDIDQLTGATLTNVSVNGISGLTAADIPTDIVAANYLPLSGGTLTGTLYVPSLSASSTSYNSFTATNSTTTNATTTAFAITSTTNALLSTNGVGTVVPATVGNGLVYSGGVLSTSFGTTTQNIFTALQQFQNASTSLLSTYGPAYFGSTATSSFNSAGILSLVGNGLTVGTSQLVVSGGNVGVGTTTPFTNFAVTGNGYFGGTLTAATGTLSTLITQIANGCYNADQFPTIQSAITAAETSGCVTITPLTTDTSTWFNPNALTIIDQRATSRVGEFLGGASVTPKLANFAASNVASDTIIYFGNSTVWAGTNWFTTMAQQDIPGGLSNGMNIHQDLQSLSADSNGNVTVVLGSPSGFVVGQFVTVEPTAVTLPACIGSGIVTAVSGDQFTFTGVGTDTQCNNISSTSTGGTASQQLLNFGNNGATLATMLSNTSATSTGIGGICAVKPNLLIVRGPLINDVRTGNTNLAQAEALERQLLDKVRSCSPNTDILLKTENSLLTTNVNGSNYVTPNSSAQAYSTILEQAVTSFTNVYPNVVVLDTQQSLYGTTSPSTSAYMSDQLHPSVAGYTAEAKEDIQVLTQLMNNGFQNVGTVDPNNPNPVPFSPYLSQNARANSYTQPWTYYSQACADPNYYTLVAQGTSLESTAAGQTYLDLSWPGAAQPVIQSFDVVQQQSAGCWQLSSGVYGAADGSGTRLFLSGQTTPYNTNAGEEINVWRPKYIVQAAEGYVKNPITYPYRHRILIQSAGTNYFRIQFLPSEGINAALSDIQSSDFLVLNASTSVPLSNCSGLTPSVAGTNLQCNITGNESSLSGQYGWVFGTHPMEGQPNFVNQTLFGGSQKSAYATLSVWGPDAASSTLAFNVVSSASSTVFAVFDGGNAELSGTLSQSSDQRLKTDILSLDASSSLADIEGLNPVSYDRLDQEDGTNLGFIAQQVQQIFPELISTTSATALTPDGTLTLNYIGLISPIVSAIQALSGEFTSLEKTVADFSDNIVSAHITVTTGDFQQVNTNDLCVGSTCVTPAQFQAMVAAAGQSKGADDAAPPSTLTSNATDTPPVIQINGDNPATINVGDTYTDLGATITAPQADLDLGIKTFLNGTLVSNIVVDTSAVATDTIDYVATDAWGDAATSTRTVIVEAASSTVN